MTCTCGYASSVHYFQSAQSTHSNYSMLVIQFIPRHPICCYIALSISIIEIALSVCIAQGATKQQLHADWF
jgi:hypothetical protein